MLILRFFGGAIGSNSLVSSGAVVADQFSARDRGLALSYYAVTPFLGPSLGPILGGFIGEDLGWRWIEGFLAVFTGTLSIVYILAVPETYAPRILHNRAVALSKMHGAVYRTQMEMKQGRKKLWPTLKVSLSRPWVLLVVEPIVLIFSVYQAIIYATLYMCFGRLVAAPWWTRCVADRALQRPFQSSTRNSEVGRRVKAVWPSSASQWACFSQSLTTSGRIAVTQNSATRTTASRRRRPVSRSAWPEP